MLHVFVQKNLAEDMSNGKKQLEALNKFLVVRHKNNGIEKSTITI